MTLKCKEVAHGRHLSGLLDTSCNMGPFPTGSMYPIIRYLGLGNRNLVQVLGKYLIIGYLDP